jgi:hypothetical protein
MIQLCDRRSACLLLQYTCGLLSSTSTSTSQNAAPAVHAPLLSTLPSLSSLQLSPQQQQQQHLENTAKRARPTNTTTSNTNTTTTTMTTTTTKELARFIATNTPKELLWAVKQSGGRFLYRGEEPNNAAALLIRIPNKKTHGNDNDNYDDDPLFVVRICNPAPDLLLPETYGNDPFALRYFEELEAFLSLSFSAPNSATAIATPKTIAIAIAKPSNGHIATSDALEAGKWGKIVSVWPLLPSPTENNKSNNNNALFSYVWPRDRSVFYENINSNNNSNNNNNDTSTTKTTQNNSLVVNEKLQDALVAKGGREVLFAFAVTTEPGGRRTTPASTATAAAAFLAIPAELDVVLRDELERIGYGL